MSINIYKQMYILYNQSKCVCVSVCVSFSLSLFFLKKHTIMNFYLIKVDLVSSFYSLDRYLIPKDTQIRWITIVSWFLLFDYTTIKNNHNLNTWPPPPKKTHTRLYQYFGRISILHDFKIRYKFGEDA